MKKLFFVIAILFCSLGKSFAQSDSYSLTLKKMLQATDSEATFKVAIKQMITMFKQQKTNVPESIWNEFENEFLSTSLDDLVAMLSPVYKKHISEDELKKIIEFYQTPAGKKFAEKTPIITQESMQVGQQWGMKIGQKFQEKLKEKGY